MSANKLLIELARKYPFRILLNAILGFSGALFNGVSMVLLVPVFLLLLGRSEDLGNTGPKIIQYLLTPFAQLPEQYQLPVMVLTVLLAIILKNVTSYFNSLSSSSLSRALTADLQESGLKLILDLDLDYFTKAKAGDLMNRLGGEMSRSTTQITAMINMGITVINIFVYLAILLAISWQLTLAATLLLPLSALVSQYLIARSKYYGKLITALNQEYSGGLIEVLGGIRLVKAAGNEQREFERFRNLIRKREAIDFQAKMASAAISPIGEITNILITFSLVLLARNIYAEQPEAIQLTLLPFLFMLLRLLPIVSQINSHRAGLARSAASVEIVYDLMRRDNKTFMASGSIQYSSFRKGIRFESLNFAYPGCSDLSLQDINLYIPKGTTLALVGSSGAGKSTLADLLPRFYDPTGGRITIDGVDLREFELRSLRRAMGIVSQDTFLFNESVRNNIAYGVPDVREEQVVDAIKRANAYEFIMRLPQGLDTLIGDRGVMLSGGQRQRLAIARALLKNPEILILDEATSALDTVSEHLVQQAIDELSRERTTLVIAHRLSTIHRADQIAVLEHGRVVELGTHAELLQRSGTYSKLYSMQFSETSKKMRSAAEAQKQLFAKASYEFRGRLNSMLGSLSLLADGLIDTPEEQNELAEEAYRSALELFQIVRRLEKVQPTPQSIRLKKSNSAEIARQK
jgi:subfamily B ATP-binding cassette protein MsbA